MNKLKVGFVGVGLMGLPMVRNIANHVKDLINNVKNTGASKIKRTLSGNGCSN